MLVYEIQTYGSSAAVRYKGGIYVIPPWTHQISDDAEFISCVKEQTLPLTCRPLDYIGTRLRSLGRVAAELVLKDMSFQEVRDYCISLCQILKNEGKEPLFTEDTEPKRKQDFCVLILNFLFGGSKT